jgi:hypothetical protein
MLTYKELQNKLNQLTESQLNDMVAIFVHETCEFYSVQDKGFQISKDIENDVLHDNHVYLEIGN